MYHGMYKEAVDVASGTNDVIEDLFRAQSIEGLEYLGELNEKELRAYKVAMDPVNEGFDDLDDEEIAICDEVTEKYYERMPWLHFALPWVFRDHGWGNTKWEILLENALEINLPAVRNDKVDYARIKAENYAIIYTEGILEYPNPTCIVVYDTNMVSDVDIVLFFWAKYEVE